MKLTWTFRFVLVAVTVTALATGCSSKKPGPTAPPTAPEPAATSPTMPEQVVEPTTPAVPSQETVEELPADIQELNRRGYLKDVFFDTDRSELTPEARQLLSQNADWLQKYASVKIVIEGHCDERNTRDYNLALGDRRANTVRSFFLSLGVSGERITTITYGEERPFAVGSDESAWKLNRRAHFVITGR
jgi:peptidoglycan-associated lipoprotein